MSYTQLLAEEIINTCYSQKGTGTFQAPNITNYNYYKSYKSKDKELIVSNIRSLKCPRESEVINQIIFKMCQKKGITPCYKTVYRYIQKNNIVFPAGFELKPVIEEQIALLAKKYVNRSIYTVYISSLLKSIGEFTNDPKIDKKNIALLCTMVEKWTYLIKANNGYVSRDLLFSHTKGDKNTLFKFQQLLLDTKWFEVEAPAFVCYYNKNLSLVTKYYVGRCHILFDGIPAAPENAWERIGTIHE